MGVSKKFQVIDFVNSGGVDFKYDNEISPKLKIREEIHL